MFRILNNQRVSKGISSLMLFAILFNNIIFPSKAFALTSGPSQPEFSSFDSASASEMVNLFTGDFNYNIPLMDVDGYPINIAYHASPGMDQEASWVGLGWNINSGSINRSMRGLPDDFNGEDIQRELKVEDFKSWGVGIGGGVEIVGLNGASFGLSGGMGVTKSNYKGVGLEFYFEPTMALAAGKKLQGSLTAGLGLKASTTDGTSIYPQLGVGGQLKTAKTISSIGLNMGAAYNSRDGLKSFNAGVGLSFAKGKGYTNRRSTATGNNGVGIGFGSSASIPLSSQGFMPQMQSDMKSQSYSLDFKLGGNACVTAPFGFIRGYYAQNGMTSSDITLKGYGYLNSQNGDRQALQDFSREKDGMMYPETPNLPITNYTYDMFFASAQGMEMAFRPQRNDMGTLYDNSTTESSFGVGASGEVLVAPDINVGVNANTQWSNGDAGRWDDYNFMLNSAQFSSPLNDYEAAYFKVAGEKTADDNAFLTSVMNEKPVTVKMDKISDEDWMATNALLDNAGNTQFLSPNFRKSKRAVRNTLVSTLNANDAQYAAVDKNIISYYPTQSICTTGQNIANVVNMTNPATPYGELLSNNTSYTANRLAFANNKKDHISEITVTQPSGGRYVYGIPVYNRTQQEVMFNISGSGLTHATAPMGLVPYMSGTDDSKSNSKGLDHFYEKNTIPDYTHSFLLTEILSSDYVDRTGNGPSQDDYGDYTKFNYSLASSFPCNPGTTGYYRWRIPYQAGKAAFNQGFLSDKADDKGSYVYGTRDLWIPHSIETKNHIAIFVTEGRNDGIGEGGFIGSNYQFTRLKEIRLYAKKSLIANAINGVAPIKVVHFEYDYSLCPGIPNNGNTVTMGTAAISNGIPINGKLTLKKIYFTYGNTNKGSLTPYTFTYCNGNYTNTTDNPTYDPSSVDRWGYYQKNLGGSGNNIDFPYTVQDTTVTNKNARAWNLTEIRTPAGSKINVAYEADDYAYVQSKEAGQMFKIAGATNTAAGSSSGGVLYGNDYLVVDLSASKADGVLLNTPNALNVIKDKYFKGLSQVYIKACVELTAGKYEFIPLYADIDNISFSNSCTYTYGANTYYNVVIKLRTVGVNDDNSSTLINPIVKAAFQLGRTYLPGVIFPGSQTAGGTNETIIKGLVTMVQDMTSLFSGINKALYNRKVAKLFDPARSVVRLYNPVGKKLGGGSRVKKIVMDDNWNAMTGEASSTYGQIYSYTTQRNGVDISSGVAGYEPLNGGDENSNRAPIPFSINRMMAPNDEYFQEAPLGESLYPDPLVGYSKVTVKNLDRPNVTKHATGKTEYEFYTARDFPVFTEKTDLDKQPVKPELIKSLLNFGSTDKLYMSQGYCIRTNDMHGKPKGEKHYEQGDNNTPYSGITYYYKTKAGTTNQLDNSVSVINPGNTISTKAIGQTTDIITDARHSASDMWGAGVGVNVNLATCTFYVPLVFVWPSFSHEKREFNSITTTKVVNQYGLIDYAVAFDNHSTVETRNLLYDEETGETVMTRTVNDFDQPVYSLKYPAYWAYDRMGHGYKNTGISLTANNVNYINTSGQISGSYLVPGDEVLAKINPAGTYVQTWVAANAGGQTFLIKNDGLAFINNNVLPVDIELKVTRSGRRNMQELPMASLSSLVNPTSNNKIVVTSATKVLNSSALEYSENWQTILGQAWTAQCSCVMTPFAAAEQAFIAGLFTTAPFSTGIQSTSPNNGYNSTPYTFGLPNTLSLANYPFISTFLQQLPNYFTNLPVSFTISKSSSLGFDVLDIAFNPNFIKLCSPSTTYKIQLLVTHNTNSPNPAICDWTRVTSIANYQHVDCCGASVRPSSAAPLSNQCPGILFDLVGAPGTQFASNAIDNLNASTICLNRQNCTQTTASQCGKLLNDQVNPYLENLRGNWRPKYNYSYLVSRNATNNIAADGDYSSFRPFYDQQLATAWLPIYGRTFNNNVSKPYDNWVRGNEVQLINQHGNTLQNKDALNRQSSSLYGYNNTLAVAAASNARYNEIAFDGFEDYDYLYKECAGVPGMNTNGFIGHFNFYPDRVRVTQLSAHTGRYSIIVTNALSVNSPSKLIVSRKFTDNAPTGSPDNVPYTLKAIDDAGLFGPLYNTAQTYVLSVWAREVQGLYMLTSPEVNTYTGPSVNIKLNSTPVTPNSVKRSAIINGWQKLEYEFNIPSTSVATSINIELVNSGTQRACLFDDLRIHPFNSSMQTMVYDPITLRLMAEHDDRNFSIIYEYDDEGNLVRMQRETEKGIYTIRETRSGLRK